MITKFYRWILITLMVVGITCLLVLPSSSIAGMANSYSEPSNSLTPKLGSTPFYLTPSYPLSPSSTAVPVNPPVTSPQAYLPFITHVPPPIHAMRVAYADYEKSRGEVDQIEKQMQAAGINMVGLGAGRVEWTYFKWAGHEANWSNDIKSTQVDYLAEDTNRFGKWAHINAVVDVFAPNYIKAHPETAAISFVGQPSQNLVSTTELVSGEFGQQLLDMIDYIAANYPVDSISLTELFYHIDGYGPDDKASYLAYSAQYGNPRTDWPRTTDGTIDINDISIGNWRTHVLDVYLDKIVAACHKYGKKFFMDVGLSLDDLTKVTNEHGTNYNVVLEHTDKLVIWGYFELDDYPPEYFEDIAQFLKGFGQDRVILSIGLWNKAGGATTASKLETAILASQSGGMPNLWITPSTLMDVDHWNVLEKLWGR